jgi:hypothetical protein
MTNDNRILAVNPSTSRPFCSAPVNDEQSSPGILLNDRSRLRVLSHNSTYGRERYNAGYAYAHASCRVIIENLTTSRVYSGHLIDIRMHCVQSPMQTINTINSWKKLCKQVIIYISRGHGKKPCRL